MKRIIAVCLLLVLLSCQKEEFREVEGQEETSFLADVELTRLINSVSSHDGRFDDIVDNSSCFSINFPYHIMLNGELHNVQSINDLLTIDEQDVVEPVYPIRISTADYLEWDINNESQFEDFVSQCENGQLYDERITCVDFEYPISVAVFNTATSSFETVLFEHDEDTFTGIADLDAEVLATIGFPITLTFDNGSTLEVMSNDQLKNEILSVVPICN